MPTAIPAMAPVASICVRPSLRSVEKRFCCRLGQAIISLHRIHFIWASTHRHINVDVPKNTCLNGCKSTYRYRKGCRRTLNRVRHDQVIINVAFVGIIRKARSSSQPAQRTNMNSETMTSTKDVIWIESTSASSSATGNCNHFIIDGCMWSQSQQHTLMPSRFGV